MTTAALGKTERNNGEQRSLEQSTTRRPNNAVINGDSEEDETGRVRVEDGDDTLEVFDTYPH